MHAANDPRMEGYEFLYREFNSPFMQRVRREAYGEDIGQHSWVAAEELRRDIPRLNLAVGNRLLDLGCGPCGPLAFILASVGCSGLGVDLSPSALGAGRLRAEALGISDLLAVLEADVNEPLPFESGSFDVAIALDVVLHVPNRMALFQEVARVLHTGARFLFTDAGVLTGSISSDEVRERSVHGYTQFAAPGLNETLAKAAGFRMVESENRTRSMLTNARGRLAAMRAHWTELEQVLGVTWVVRQERYLETVVGLSARGAVSRMMYLVEVVAA
jgi:SAM-dependent methyltransferase